MKAVAFGWDQTELVEILDKINAFLTNPGPGSRFSSLSSRFAVELFASQAVRPCNAQQLSQYRLSLYPA
ncbi:MAG: hypothetical protein LBL45_05915 [Treponema sp.]|nr:hypothetical protein [Treponema sp.]